MELTIELRVELAHVDLFEALLEGFPVHLPRSLFYVFRYIILFSL